MTSLLISTIALGTASAQAVEVAVVKSWGTVPVFGQLNDNWHAYGSIHLHLDTSLMEVESFTYEDLVATGADVLWLSDSAGGQNQFSNSEVEAIQRYANEGHSVLGTFSVFQWASYDNRALLSLFGLNVNLSFSLDRTPADDDFDILSVNHPLFRDLPDPYVTGGYDNAQVPADDLTWDPGDLGMATLMAQTPDRRGVITWYETSDHHAIFVSKMVEYHGNVDDTQFLYNALTVPAPGALVALGIGGLCVARRRRR